MFWYVYVAFFFIFFFFKQKTAYEMRISDWSSDVCSSDLRSRSSRAKSRDGSKHVSTSLDTNGYGIIMCGIIGILGKDEVTDRLVEGLRRLEYRGYDSAGVSTIVDGHIERRRADGQLDNLAKTLSADPLAGRLGSAHTRLRQHRP